MLVIGELLDESIYCGDRRIGLTLLVVGVGHLQHGLLCIAAIGVARLQLLVVLDRAIV